MDQNDQTSNLSEQFRAFRKTVHLESPLEFMVVLIVAVCLIAGVGVWIKTPPHWYLLKHGMFRQLLGSGPRPGNNPAGSGAGPQPPANQPAVAAKGIIRITKQKPVGSTNSALPNGLEIVLVPDRIMTPAALKVKFSGEVGEIHSSIDSAEVLEAQSGILVANPDTIVMEWRTPPFGPFAPLLLTVFSKDKIQVESVDPIPYNYPYQGGDLK
jgi:hypothetical protein